MKQIESLENVVPTVGLKLLRNGSYYMAVEIHEIHKKLRIEPATFFGNWSKRNRMVFEGTDSSEDILVFLDELEGVDNFLRQTFVISEQDTVDRFKSWMFDISKDDIERIYEENVERLEMLKKFAAQSSTET